MPHLVPTILERVARCETRVHIKNGIPGAQVQLTVSSGGINIFYSSIVNGVGRATFSVSPLAAGSVITLRQEAPNGDVASGDPVIVENAESPPTTSPNIHLPVDECAECVFVTSLVPGSMANILQGTTVIGEAKADRFGRACVPIEPIYGIRNNDRNLLVSMTVCNQEGPRTNVETAVQSTLQTPNLERPLFGCVRTITAQNLNSGARTRIESDSTGLLGSICNCGENIRINLPRQLQTNERIRIQQYRSSHWCDGSSEWSRWYPVRKPDSAIQPEIEPVLIEGMRTIHVTNQIEGAEITVFFRASTNDTAYFYEPVPASVDTEFTLPEILEVGNEVKIRQTLCEISEDSEWIAVQPLPPEIYKPIVDVPLYDCARWIQISGLHPGATVRVYINGYITDVVRSKGENSVTVECPRLRTGDEIYAVQSVAGIESPNSDIATVIDRVTSIDPKIARPTARGENLVNAAGIQRGALVKILSDNELVGWRGVAETFARVAVSDIRNTVVAEADYCNETRQSERYQTIRAPSIKGEFEDILNSLHSFGPYTVDEHENYGQTTSGGYPVTLRGQLYCPLNREGEINSNNHLVLVAHGQWGTGYLQRIADGDATATWITPAQAQEKLDEDKNSYKGYQVLCEHLASWGMLVYSLDLSEVNRQTYFPSDDYRDLETRSRGILIIEAINQLKNHAVFGPTLTNANIGLVGHSVGAEGAIAAAEINEEEGGTLNIAGVVGLGPAALIAIYSESDRLIPNINFLQIFGSQDHLHKIWSLGTFSRSGVSKHSVWVHSANHWGWNKNWFQSENVDHEPSSNSIELAQFEQISKHYVNAFFQSVLFDNANYESYCSDHIAQIPQVNKYPQSLQSQYTGTEQIVIIGSEGFSTSVNNIGTSMQATGAQLLDYRINSSTAYKFDFLQLAWTGPNAYWESDLPDISVATSANFSVRVGQYVNEDGESNLNYRFYNQDFYIVLQDQNGRQAKCRVGSVSPIIPPDYMTEELVQENGYPVIPSIRTIRIPLICFYADNTSLNFGAIRKLRFEFSASPHGDIIFNQIEIRNNTT